MDISEQVKDIPEGGTIEMPIERSPDFRHFTVETIATSPSMSGDIILTGLASRVKTVSQRFVVDSHDDNSASLSGSEVKTVNQIVEVGALQVGTATALSLALILVRHAVKMGADPTELKAALTKEDWF